MRLTPEEHYRRDESTIAYNAALNRMIHRHNDTRLKRIIRFALTLLFLLAVYGCFSELLILMCR